MCSVLLFNNKNSEVVKIKHLRFTFYKFPYWHRFFFVLINLDKWKTEKQSLKDIRILKKVPTWEQLHHWQQQTGKQVKKKLSTLNNYAMQRIFPFSKNNLL